MTAKAGSNGTIDVSELAALLERPTSSVRLVDCRYNLADPGAGRRAYDEGHLPEAVFADLERHLSGSVVKGTTGRHPLPEVNDLSAQLSAWGVDASTLVVAYDDGSAMFAPRLWWLLRWLGHTQVAVLLGGVAAWTAAGHALSRKAPAIQPAVFTPNVNPALLATLGEVVAIARGETEEVLLDARAPARYRGEQEPIDPVAGHIPTARNLPFTTLLEAGEPRGPQDVQSLVENALGDRSDAPLVAYCGSGVTACALIWAIQARDPRRAVRLYPGSWSEWVTSPARPVATGNG